MPLRWSWKGLGRAHGYKHVASLRLGPGVSNSNTDPQQRAGSPQKPADNRKVVFRKRAEIGDLKDWNFPLNGLQRHCPPASVSSVVTWLESRVTILELACQI